VCASSLKTEEFKKLNKVEEKKRKVVILHKKKKKSLKKALQKMMRLPSKLVRLFLHSISFNERMKRMRVSE
jgi:hypothetical protein